MQGNEYNGNNVSINCCANTAIEIEGGGAITLPFSSVSKFEPLQKEECFDPLNVESKKEKDTIVITSNIFSTTTTTTTTTGHTHEEVEVIGGVKSCYDEIDQNNV